MFEGLTNPQALDINSFDLHCLESLNVGCSLNNSLIGAYEPRSRCVLSWGWLHSKKGCLFLNPWKFSLNLFWSSYVALKTHIDITLSSIAFNIFKVKIWRRDGRIPIWCTRDHGHNQRLSVHLNLWWAYWSLFFKGVWLMSTSASVRASLAGSFAGCRAELSHIQSEGKDRVSVLYADLCLLEIWNIMLK